ncbi:MAG TPA: ECF transporter S component [Solirubrobacterales bacterium]|jgi:energy-coupling factor transport system substrate-specific component|nr:ECF transporter S component [Solirubrobacterales bacterium]
MTDRAVWQLSTAAILVLALVSAFAWFERTRPSARVAATVAMLAAFAVIGRIAFAPFPNIKPTTDIVIIAGFALGAAPGFTVGALAALVSNFYFAQGPWTPWQMAAWGLCGLFGALIGHLTRRQISRLPLAVCCAVAGLGFGVVMNFASAVNFGGADIVTSYLVYQVQSLPFDFAHAGANFVFCLIAGPALVRMLERLRQRAVVVWPSLTVHDSSPSPALNET